MKQLIARVRAMPWRVQRLYVVSFAYAGLAVVNVITAVIFMLAALATNDRRYQVAVLLVLLIGQIVIFLAKDALTRAIYERKKHDRTQRNTNQS